MQLGTDIPRSGQRDSPCNGVRVVGAFGFTKTLICCSWHLTSLGHSGCVPKRQESKALPLPWGQGHRQEMTFRPLCRVWCGAAPGAGLVPATPGAAAGALGKPKGFKTLCGEGSGNPLGWGGQQQMRLLLSHGNVPCLPSQLCAWLLTRPAASPAGKIPPRKNVVLIVSHPEHPSDNRRDDSRLSLSSGLGKSLQIFLRPLGWRWKSAWTATAPAWNDPRRCGGTGTRRLPHPGAVPSRGEEAEAAGRDAGQPLPGGFINLQLERGRAEQQLLIARQIKLTQAAAAPGSGSSSARGREGWVDGSPVPAR